MYNISKVGERIKSHRQRLNLTQTDLAGKLNVSFQAVSNWENCVTVPDIQNLCRLALIYNVSVDSLLRGEEDKATVMVAVDGSGDKSEFVLFTSEGEVLTSFELGGTNASVHGYESVIETFSRGINICIAERLDISAVFIGTAGDRLHDIQKQISEYYSKFSIFVESHGINAIMSDKGNAALICGSGSILVLKQGDGIKRIGGWGYMLGDPGSAFNIGREAFRNAAGFRDGIVTSDVIAKKILEKTGFRTVEELPSKVSLIASAAPIVFEAYLEGDNYAERILEDEAKNVAELINSSCAADERIIVCGSIFEKFGEIMIPILKKHVKPGIEFVVPGLPPVYGAAVRCCELMGIECGESFRDNFARSYKA